MTTRTVSGAPGRSTVGTLIHLLAGPIVWAAHFLAVYGAQGAACALGAPGVVAPAIGGLTAPALLAALAVVAAPRRLSTLLRADGWGRDVERFLTASSVLLGLLSALAVVWAASTALFLPACAVPA